MNWRLWTLAYVMANVGIVYGSADAQTGTAQPDLAFEVASVKPSSPDRHFTTMQGGPGSSDPGRITYSFINLRNLLAKAYDVGYDGIVGPGWLDDVRFDVIAAMAHGTTQEQFRLMLLNLLKERFKLVAHFESRKIPGYALVVAKKRPILKDAGEYSVSGDGHASVGQLSAGQPKVDQDGFTVTPVGPGVSQVCIEGGCRFRATRASMQELAAKLPCRCPIVDETHLTGKYEFTLTCDVRPLVRPEFQDDQARSADHGRSFPDVFHALETQLGLKLKPKKVPTNLVRIDRIDRVSVEN